MQPRDTLQGAYETMEFADKSTDVGLRVAAFGKSIQLCGKAMVALAHWPVEAAMEKAIMERHARDLVQYCSRALLRTISPLCPARPLPLGEEPLPERRVPDPVEDEFERAWALFSRGRR